MPVTKRNSALAIQNAADCKGSCIAFCEIVLNQGRAADTINKAKPNEMTTTRYDSAKNCAMSCLRPDPRVLRTPTSLALFSERAVLRFMKLIQASNNTNTPIEPMNQTSWIGPFCKVPSL